MIFCHTLPARPLPYPVGMSNFIDAKAFSSGKHTYQGAFWQRMLCLLVIASAAPAAAGNWVFQPSYYSHQIAPPDRPLPSSRSSYRIPSVSNNPGFSVRGEYRVNYLRFRNGSSTDLRIQYRGNVEIDP